MKRQTENTAAPKALSTPTIVVLAVGGALILYMLLQPMFSPKDKLSGSGVKAPGMATSARSKTARLGPAGSAARETLNTELTAVAPEKAAPGELSSGRDPFLPSSSYVRKVADANREPDVQPGPAATAPVVEIQPKPAVVPTAAPRTDQFAWRGVVGDSGPQQVVLIQHNARTYILRQGDPVPGTKYTVAEVTAEMVVLASPNEQLRLAKKKEAKING